MPFLQWFSEESRITTKCYWQKFSRKVDVKYLTK